MTADALAYPRILLKYSGEVLRGNAAYGVEPEALSYVIQSIRELKQLNVEIAVVLGGGNYHRGKNLLSAGFDQVKSDQMGMLATVMNGMALQHVLSMAGIDSVLYSALPMEGLVETYVVDTARLALQQKRVVICAGGTGLPFFTTDTAAALRAIELQANIVLKATKVDGIYCSDPTQNKDAKRFDSLSYEEALNQKLGVMDMTAITICAEHHMPIQVFDMNNTHALAKIVKGERVGTLVGVKHVK
jgi:uridylate kinase